MENDGKPLVPAGVVRFELAPVTIAWIVAAVGGVWLLCKLWSVVLLLLVALVFVGTFNPVVERLEARGLKRVTALIILLLGLCLTAALLLFLTVPALLEQLGLIVEHLPGERERLIAALGRHGLTAPFGRALSGVGAQQALESLQNGAVGYSSDALTLFGYAITTFFLSVYLLADGKRTQGTLYAVVPRRFHMRLARIIHNLQTIVGGYMRGQLVTSVALGAFVFLLLAVCGVPNALPLALFAAMMDVFPFVGGLLAAIPVVLTALSHDQSTGVLVACCMFVYQMFENKILVPKVYGSTLRLSPAVVVLALVAGGVLLGMIGALLALPIAAGLQMIIKELGVELPGDDIRAADAWVASNAKDNAP
jgi:predicted PurR-regulated permease PerM